MNAFFADYECRPHPSVAEAIAKACSSKVDGPYGQDKTTRRATETIQSFFGGRLTCFFVSSGTAANRLALSTLLCHSIESVICSKLAHINTFEAGAIESLGHKLLTFVPRNGKVKFLQSIEALLKQRSDTHLTYPSVLSVSNATEVGTVYTYEELGYLGHYAHDNDLKFHIDGARLSNAAAHLNVKNLFHLSFGINADAVTMGGAKNGGGLGDLVIFRDSALAKKVAARLHKQQGQLCPRVHLIAAQFDALFTNNLWFQNAQGANMMATLLAERCTNEMDLPPLYPVQSNAVFLKLPRASILSLKEEAGIPPWDEKKNVVRFMSAWDTTTRDVDDLVCLVKKHLCRT